MSTAQAEMERLVQGLIIKASQAASKRVEEITRPLRSALNTFNPMTPRSIYAELANIESFLIEQMKEQYMAQYRYQLYNSLKDTAE